MVRVTDSAEAVEKLLTGDDTGPVAGTVGVTGGATRNAAGAVWATTATGVESTGGEGVWRLGLDGNTGALRASAVTGAVLAGGLYPAGGVGATAALGVADDATGVPELMVVPVEAVTSVLRPPVACTIPSRGSAADVVPAGGVPADDPADDDGVAFGGVTAFGGVNGDVAAPGSVFDGGVGSVAGVFGVEEASAGELGSCVAHAIPGAPATAAPIPMAIASAPTRPM